ncbi:hypothetical protein [Micromonospora matsumotoense]
MHTPPATTSTGRSSLPLASAAGAAVGGLSSIKVWRHAAPRAINQRILFR